jgi:hypothetical protein
MKRPLPKAMRDERAKLQARRDHLAWLVAWFDTLEWTSESLEKDRAELAQLELRLAGFTAFENGL